MSKRRNDLDNQQAETVSPDDSADSDLELGLKHEVEAESEAGTAAAHEVEELQAQVAEKDKEIAELKDKYLRALAETENTRKRLRQQSEETVRQQRENLLRELLPMVDNLERAVGAAQGGGNGKSIVEGVELVLRSMLDFLKGHDVVQISALGEPFDPSRHEAVDHIESQQHPPNTVVNEFNRGYLIGQRMLRPARVAVAKGSSHGNGEHGGNDLENG